MSDSGDRFRALQESEERLQAFMRHSPALAFMKDADGRYVYVNPQMERTFQIKLAEIQGKADFDWLPEAVARKVRENDQSVLARGETLELVETVPMPDGTVHHWMVVKFPFTQTDGQQFVGGMAMDITARMATEAALRRKEEEVRTLLENTPDIVARFDRQLRHVYVNRAAALLRQLSVDALTGKTLEEVGVSPEQRGVLEGQIRQVFDTGKETSFEGMDPSPDPVYHQVRLTPEFDDAGAIATVLVGSRDVTSLKQTEKRLIESERRFRRLFESGLGLMCTHDLAGRLLSINAAAAQALGYDGDVLIGRDIRELLMPVARPNFDQYLERVRQNGTDHGLMPLLQSDGAPRVWKYHNALVSESGTPDYVLGHAQDVTELKRAQERAKSLSLTDDLTGLYNRRGFLTLAERHVKLARRPSEKGVLLVYGDMDGLKQINDRFGHQEGSLAIIKMGELLKRSFRETDIIARLGGDEFVVLNIHAADNSADMLSARIQENVRAYNVERHHPFDLSLSVGTAAVDWENPLSMEELLKKADEAMYQEKRRKKGSRAN